MRHEIVQNFKSCAIEHVKDEFAIKQNKEPFQFRFNECHIRFEEFDKIKYELLKYDSEIIKHTLEVYEMFYTLSKSGDYKDLSIEQIQSYIELYVLYGKKYITN